MRVLSSAILLVASLALGVMADIPELIIETTYKPPECPIKSKDGDLLSMHYTGTLLDGGSKFDSSLDRNQPFEFTLGGRQVITGWEKGLQDMCVTEKRKLTIPSNMAYGSRGFGTVIPAFSALVFEVELLGIKNRAHEDL